eukprot:CAMPEP_0197005358 /NCGR_PEP_ID=MMETSP1380-20130617/28873_1 /TAXON_ID=5936 /ORGANISM="Euplotes crassus, Strain CT5" /LENGTH=91 /DNA_ID=CAMNT_0042424461 /DNA_START=13 /DNA_END=288 /DNA_ORIENTATION=+
MASSNVADTTLGEAQKKLSNSTLLDFEYKFCITAADSHLGKSSGRLYINLKMSIRNKYGKKEDLYMELSLEQFYEFFAELKKAAALMSMMS